MVPRKYKVPEDIGQLEVYAKIVEGALDRDAVIVLHSEDDSALSSEGDYTNFTETLTFHSGSQAGAEVSVTVSIGDDRLVEDPENFIVILSSLVDFAVVDADRDVATVIIEDDECT